jgi:hypothetical protein
VVFEFKESFDEIGIRDKGGGFTWCAPSVKNKRQILIFDSLKGIKIFISV